MESDEVYGANDPHLSSRDKDRLFADEPRPDPEQKDNTDADVKGGDPAPGMLVQPVPDRHESGGPYENEAVDATETDADFTVEETNKKGGDAE